MENKRRFGNLDAAAHLRMEKKIKTVAHKPRQDIREFL
jgi:hypothetical protein